jgi:hypothetical protein
MGRRRRRTTDLTLELAKRWDRTGRAVAALGTQGATAAGDAMRACARELTRLVRRRRTLH